MGIFDMHAAVLADYRPHVWSLVSISCSTARELTFPLPKCRRVEAGELKYVLPLVGGSEWVLVLVQVPEDAHERLREHDPALRASWPTHADETGQEEICQNRSRNTRELRKRR
jgi:hypothetical protein